MKALWRAGGASLVSLILAAPAASQALPASEPAGEWRFPVGETAVYDVTFGPIHVGRSKLEVEALETLPAGEAFRVSFEIAGGPFFYKIDDRTVSWVAPEPFRSLRFAEILHQGSYRRNRRYELDQAAGTFTRYDYREERLGFEPHPIERDVEMPAAALDEIAFLYFVRSLPLEVGRTFRSERYFEADGNPVVIEVLRRERIRVAAGRFDTFVVRPIIRTDGMFGEEGRAEVYITADDRRMIVQLKTRMKVGELNMYLRDYEAGEGGGTG